MGIKVVTGKQLARSQKGVEKNRQRGELVEMLRDLMPGRLYQTMDYYLDRRYVRYELHYGLAAFRQIALENPVSSLALIDLIEVLVPFRGGAESFELHVQARKLLKLFHDRTYTLSGRVEHPEPYAVAGAMTAATEKIKMAYGRCVMADIQLKVHVVETPVYVSPRAQLVALQAAERAEETGLAAAAQDYEEESIQEGEVIY